MSSSPKRLRKHSQNDFLSLMISSKRLPSSSYQQITELNLSNLQLIQIQTFPFEYLPKLISLDLSYNQLTIINIDWSKTQENKIETLNLNHNKLETLLFLKDFKHLKLLNITDNLLRNTERFLSLLLCPTIEHLIDSNQDQIDDEQLKLDQWLELIETKISRLWLHSYYDKYQQEITNTKPNNQIIKMLLDDFRHGMIRIFEKQTYFSQIHQSPLANYLIEKKINEICSVNSRQMPSKQSLKTHLTADFDRLMETKIAFEPMTFVRCHHTSEHDLTSVSIRMCAFEPNTTKNILATCGGQKICFINCDTCEVTHLYEVSSLRSTVVMPIGRKMKEKTLPINIAEHFSCLCWIEIFEENESYSILAVGASNGHIYLLSYLHKLMFGHIELPSSSISCLTWHTNDPTTLVIGSYHTVRLLNIQSYLERFRTFVRKQNKSTIQFDYIESGTFNSKLSSAQIYNFDNGDDSILHVTDIIYYSDKIPLILLVGTTAGLFYIQNQIPMRFIFPKSMSTIGESIESIRLIPNQRHLIAINLLGFDQICFFDLEQSLANRQLHLVLSLANPYRQISTKMAIYSINNENDQNGLSFECAIGSDHGTIHYHHIRMNTNSKKNNKKPTFDTKYYEIPLAQAKNSSQPSFLSSSLNEHYLCSTTNNNLICIYKRK